MDVEQIIPVLISSYPLFFYYYLYLICVKAPVFSLFQNVPTWSPIEWTGHGQATPLCLWGPLQNSPSAAPSLLQFQSLTVQFFFFK